MVKDLNAFFRSVVEQDRNPVVICDLSHEIVYMNPAAVENYGKRGGAGLIGKSLLDCHSPESREKIRQVAEWFAKSPENNIVYTSRNEKQDKDIYMVALRDGEELIGYYEKHEPRGRETMRMYHNVSP